MTSVALQFATVLAVAAAAPASAQTFFDLSAIDIDGNEISFAQYAGDVVLVVNVATV